MNCFEHVDWSRCFSITPKCVELLTCSRQNKGHVTYNYKSLITKKIIIILRRSSLIKIQYTNLSMERNIIQLYNIS